MLEGHFELVGQELDDVIGGERAARGSPAWVAGGAEVGGAGAGFRFSVVAPPQPNVNSAAAETSAASAAFFVGLRPSCRA